MGDVVRIIECRPMSKLKRWRLGEIVRKAVQVAWIRAASIWTARSRRAGQKSLAPKSAGPKTNTPDRREEDQ